jgi:hypothetical protein
LSAICLAARPIVAVLGQAIIDIRFHIDRWMNMRLALAVLSC